MLGVVARVFLITIVPLAARAWCCARATRSGSIEHEPRIKKVTLGVFVLVVVGAVVERVSTVIAEHFTELALATLTLNVAAMSIAYTVARVRAA